MNQSDFNLKAKYQAFSQIYLFGYAYVVWVVGAIVEMVKNKFRTSDNFLWVFLILYFLLILDPLNLNKNNYAYVLSISPKYMLIVLPLISLILSKYLAKIPIIIKETFTIKSLFIIWLFFLCAIALFVEHLSIDWMPTIERFIPMFRDYRYYYLILFNWSNILLYAGLGTFILALLIVSIKGLKLSKQYIYHHEIHFLAILILYSLPFVIAFDNNYSVKDILTHTFTTSASEKLKIVKGGEDYYSTILRILSQTSTEIKDMNVLIIGVDPNFTAYRLGVKQSNIQTPQDEDEAVKFVTGMPSDKKTVFIIKAVEKQNYSSLFKLLEGKADLVSSNRTYLAYISD